MTLSSRRTMAGLLVLALLLTATPGYTATIPQKKNEVRDLKTKLGTLQRAADGATRQYQDAQAKLSETENELLASQTQLEIASSRQGELQKVLYRRVQHIYRHGYISFADVLASVRSFDEFLLRWEWLTRIGEQDANLLTEMKLVRNQIEQETEQLRMLKARRQSESAELMARSAEIEARLGDLDQLYKKAQKELSAMVKAERERRRRLAAARAAALKAQLGDARVLPAVNGYVFPVAGAYSYTNDWGEPRSGGRTHKGTDVFARMGTPSVAVIAGRVHSEYNNGSAGHSIHLYGDDGIEYKYFHMSGFALMAGRVKAGQVIGYVGDTGNAKGTPPHLHFEIHPGGGSPINPYPFLRAWEGY